jgi:hypothetical protein
MLNLLGIENPDLARKVRVVHTATLSSPLGNGRLPMHRTHEALCKRHNAHIETSRNHVFCTEEGKSSWRWQEEKRKEMQLTYLNNGVPAGLRGMVFRPRQDAN